MTEKAKQNRKKKQNFQLKLKLSGKRKCCNYEMTYREHLLLVYSPMDMTITTTSWLFSQSAPRCLCSALEPSLSESGHKQVSSPVCNFYHCIRYTVSIFQGISPKPKRSSKIKTAADQGKQVELCRHRTNLQAVLSLGHLNKPSSPRPRARRAKACRRLAGDSRAAPISPAGV